MIKPALFGLLLLTTVLRFANIIFVLTRDDINLPPLVLVSASIMALYGIALLVKRIFSKIRVKQFMYFFIIHSVVIAFNIIFTVHNNSLQLTAPEVMLIGTFFDLIVYVCIVYACLKHMRSSSFSPV